MKIGTTRISNIDRQIRIRSIFISRINSIFASAKQEYWTTSRIRDLLSSNVFDTNEWKRVSSYIHLYVRGYIDANHHEINKLQVWMKWIDGKLMTTAEIDNLIAQERQAGLDKDPDYDSPWFRVNGELSRFCWIDSNGNPVRDKPLEEKFVLLTDILAPKSTTS